LIGRGLFVTKQKQSGGIGGGGGEQSTNHTSLGIFKYIGSKLVSENCTEKKINKQKKIGKSLSLGIELGVFVSMYRL
jgi:hypothetical protein